MRIASYAVHTDERLDQTTGSASTPHASSAGSKSWSSGARCGARPYVAIPTRRFTALLLAAHVRIRRLRCVEARTMVGVADEECRIEHHLRQARVIRIIDVLRLVRNLVIVAMLATRQRHARHTVARIAVVV